MERVKGHRRAGVKVGSYSRKGKPKRHTGVHSIGKKKYTIEYYQDDQGRLMSKRKWS